MAYVITEACVGVKDRACVGICPCDCITEGTLAKEGMVYDMLFIDPEECIDCGLCEPECPVGAIYHEIDIPTSSRHFTEINAEFHRSKGSQREKS